MRVGTKSLLFGVHQFVLHPLLVARGWWRTQGRFPWDPRLWAAFALHDVGYWGAREMNTGDGSRHPERGARYLRELFGDAWGRFALYHSRLYAAMAGVPVSALAIADKEALLLEWRPWYLARAWASGELFEYMGGRPIGSLREQWHAAVAWHQALCEDTRAWIAAQQGRGAWAARGLESPGDVSLGGVRDGRARPVVAMIEDWVEGQGATTGVPRVRAGAGQEAPVSAELHQLACP